MTDPHRYAVILAGGKGTRLWPISTAEQPKQFRSLGDSRPLIAQTFDRLAACVGADRVFVSTTEGYAADVRDHLPDLVEANLILEPRLQGKPMAFLLIAERLHREDPEAVVLTAAADSFVAPTEAFIASCDRAFEFVEANRRWTTILGKRATRPDTALGYIRAFGAAMGSSDIHVAREFVEKPGEAAAEELVARGDTFWNSSHYCFSAATLLTAYRVGARHAHDAVTAYVRSGDAEDYDGSGAPAHELTPLIDGGWQIGVMDCDYAWHDIGTWPSLYRAVVETSGATLFSSGDHIDLGSDDSLVVNDSALTVVTAGLRDLAIVVSDTVVLVTPLSLADAHPEVAARLQTSYLDRLTPVKEDP